MDLEALKKRLTEAALAHVVFDGWSQASFENAVRTCGTDLAFAQVLFPRAAFDMAIFYHKMGDKALQSTLDKTDMSAMKMREKVAFAVHTRLNLSDKEAVRYAASLFALPHNTATGSRLIWRTADCIWNTLGDTAQDYNWYTKRALLCAVYSTAMLYWLSDDSENHTQTAAFIDRRISQVMQIEKLKAKPTAQKILHGPLAFLTRIKAPHHTHQ